MKFFTQKTDGYIGNTKLSVRSYGCLGTSFGMILEVNPREIFNHAEYFNSDGLLINPQKLCDDFGGEWNASRADLGIRPVIVETKFDGSQHFVVWDGNRFYDPLSTNGNPLRDYKIISFRNVRKKDEMIPKSKTVGRMFNASGRLLWWIPEPTDITTYFEGVDEAKDVSEIVRPIETITYVDRDVIKEVIKEVEKVVEVEVPVEIINTIIKEKELSNEEEAVLDTWHKIKNIFNKLFRKE